MSNHRTLTQNTLAGLSEMAGLLYLELLDAHQGHTSREGELRAFWGAVRFEESCAETMDYILKTAPHPAMGANLSPDLKPFLMKRWLHNYAETDNAKRD